MLTAIFFSGCRQANLETDLEQRNLASPENNNGENKSSMVFIEGGEFLMGSEDGMPHEAPVHEVSVKSFWIDAREVTVG
ncbi:MAG TPA: SUMF1/EgtB/PvdO family nonheme iron enzyme, partial [Pyrinomonadaceae bacterium]|nr:SUMF1/EgtB/PvdO family nonheme iron enzyme [Pyrinomonadaceae bacterium]